MACSAGLEFFCSGDAMMEASMMTEKPVSGKHPRMPWVTPYLTVRDAAQAIEFYKDAFGFTLRDASKAEGEAITHVEMTGHDGDVLIMFGPEGAYGSKVKAPATGGFVSPVSLYVYCDDVDALFARATAAGATVGLPVQDSHYGDHFCKLIDPDGHVWIFATYRGTHTANGSTSTCETPDS
jgi:uncharacterized glyoxalase superfamily protein PhnB